ncbi:MAG TPA: hypothetical protein VHU44_09490 [Acidobacteriaceae bacterium]|nr:hypothetical protein [Acidobacteriaceae bacterium]
MTRREKAAELRRLLAGYRGCRFRVGGSGGASGMVFLRHPDGSEYFVGGFQGASKTLVAALNLVIELLYET